MISKRPRRSNKGLQPEINKVHTILVDLVDKISDNKGLRALTNVELNADDLSLIDLKFIFITEKKAQDRIENVLVNAGFENGLDQMKLFGGNVKTTLILPSSAHCTVSFCHFDHYSLRMDHTLRHTIKVIVLDDAFLSQYEKRSIVKELLVKEPSVLVFVNISDKEGAKSKPELNDTMCVYYDIEDQESTMFGFLENQETQDYMKRAYVQRYLSYARKIGTALYKEIKYEQQIFEGNAILSIEKLEQAKNEFNRYLEVDGKGVKERVTVASRKISKSVKEQLDKFQKDLEEYQKLQYEMENFLGFVEKKQNKSVLLQISDGAIRNKIQRSEKIVLPYLDTVSDLVKDQFSEFKEAFRRDHEDWDLDAIQLPELEIEKEEIQTVLATLPGKSYEKNVSFKGIGSLLMQLRTPMFMLMPLMMVAGLFGSLVKDDDNGSVDKSTLFYNNRPCIVINKLPDYRNDKFLNFLNAIKDFNDPKKGLFNKEVEGEMVSISQLAVKESKFVKTNGKEETKQVLDYYFDEENLLLYLFLTENADRNFVLKRLFDPQNDLLNHSSSSGGGRRYGMSGMIKMVQGFTDYKYLILIALSSLIIWFVITRKKSMDQEFKGAKEREQKKLNSDFSQYVDKNVKLAVQKFTVKLLDEIKDYEFYFIQKVDENFTRKIGVEKMKKEEHLREVQQNFSLLRPERRELARKESQIVKLFNKMESLHMKIAQS